LKWGGVVSFFASEHAMRSERVLQRAGVPARLVPGPREVSPNCGVAVAFVWENEPEVARALRDSKIRFEAIHRYEFDDDGRVTGSFRQQAVSDATGSAGSSPGGGME
jgi:hypothetical protein